MSEPPSYVFTTEHGGMRVTGSRISLDSVVYAFHEGHSPETIRAQYPSLTLEQIYGAIAYYLAHREQVDDYLRQQDQRWEQLRAQQDANPSPVVQRLRAVLRERSDAPAKP